jgi:formylglycine-generating enzyme required for sulfatase activity
VRTPILLSAVAACLLLPLPAAAESAAAGAVGEGRVRILTFPGAAEVYVDGERKGTSPASPREAFVIRLSEGDHTLNAAKEGFDPVARSIYVGADTEQTLQLNLAPEIEMASLPGGCFMMGSPEDEPDRDPDEGPRHEVCLDPFEIGVYEVTFDDWDACVAAGGCQHRPDDEGWGRGRHPVINVSWQQARDYIRWLNSCGGKTGYRLPTEAEWEYAARAGTTTPFATGDCISTDEANFDGTFEYGNCGLPTQVELHHSVAAGSYAPNPWGIYDMHGNVNEFVLDCWNDGYEGAPTDGSAWQAGNCMKRVVRGGSWHGWVGYARSAYRCRSGPAFGHKTMGFRLARTPEEPAATTAQASAEAPAEAGSD